ncbi:hypothetical protein FKM82_004571 [Ascaphus truei]
MTEWTNPGMLMNQINKNKATMNKFPNGSTLQDESNTFNTSSRSSPCYRGLFCQCAGRSCSLFMFILGVLEFGTYLNMVRLHTFFHNLHR